jgi:hypothetical protein
VVEIFLDLVPRSVGAFVRGQRSISEGVSGMFSPAFQNCGEPRNEPEI